MKRALLSFVGTTLAIEHDGHARAERLLALLCARLEAAPSNAVPKVTLQLTLDAARGHTQLLADGSHIVSSEDAGALAEHLHEQIAYHLADGCHEGLMLHAAAVSAGDRALLMPAQSGSGKSTLSAWLITRGFSHLGDELQHLSERDGRVRGWLRPLEIKQGSLALVTSLLARERSPESWLHTPRGCVVAPELLAPTAQRSITATSAELAAVVFPHYTAGAGEPVLRPLSAAETSVGLLRCCLNARHLSGHGLPSAAAWARRVPGFELVYGSFGALDALLRARLRVEHATGSSASGC